MINSCMANSETILSANTHPGDSANTVITGDKFKGDGYYGRSDGLHTVQVDLAGFIGKVAMQGTLATNPVEADWFTLVLDSGKQSVDTTGLVATQSVTSVEYTSVITNTKNYNFTGNYVWVRAYVSNWTDGTVNSIRLNH
jgi:hypothetical protein|tara:strand:- start:272 stop:691 length:420 start_codon:yes stop_codon:yes gene_type:complete